MRTKPIACRALEIEGARCVHHVGLDAGRIRRRHEGPSKTLRERHGHTPLSVAEGIPSGGGRRIVGTGAEGGLPIGPEVYGEAPRGGINILALPAGEACRLTTLRPAAVDALLHVTR